MARPRKDVKFAHRSASNGRARRASMSMSDISETGSQAGSPTRNGAVEPTVCMFVSRRSSPADISRHHKHQSRVNMRRRRQTLSYAQHGLSS